MVEQSQPSVAGQLSASDADNPGLQFVAETVKGSYGSAVLQADGHWSYTLDSRADALAQDQKASDSLTVRLNDGSTTSLHIDITGTDNAPVISSGSGSVVEQSQPSVAGQLSASDADNPGLQFVAETVKGSYGSAVLQADGHWSYTLDSRADALAQDQKASDSLTVRLNDGSTTSLHIDITGTDNAPVISSGSGTVVEQSQPSVAGQLSASDADNPGLQFVAETVKGSYGSAVLQADGHWSYTLDSRADALAQDQKASDSLTVRLNDGSTTSLHIDITGTDNAPVISSGSGTVVEQSQPSVAGQLSASDADNPGLQFVAETVKGSYGSAVLQADGHWSYTLDSRADALAQDQKASDSLTVRLNDGSTTSLHIDITGTDNAPVISSGSGTVVEQSQPSVAGQLSASDADNPGLQFVAETVKGSYGSAVLQADGHWSYTLDSRADALAQDQKASDSLTVRLNDGSTTSLHIDITGTDNAPTSTGSLVTSAEDTPYVFHWGDFGVNDVDSSITTLGIKVTSLPVDGKLQYLDSSGVWNSVSTGQTISYADIAANHLRFVPDLNESGSGVYANSGIGDQKSHYAAFSFEATDGITTSHDAAITIDITPVADVPIITVDGVSISAGSAYVATPPAGDGLTVKQYTSLPNVSTSDVDTNSEVSSLLTRLNADTPTSTLISAAPQNYTASTSGGDPFGIPQDGAYRMTGLIYLEAGKSYTFSSYMDDTALLKIGGTEVLNMTFNHWGNITANTYIPSVSGYYTLDWAVYNGNNIGAVLPYLSVNGGAAVALNTTNYHLYSSLSELDSLGAHHNSLVSVSDGGYYPVSNTGAEGSVIALSPIGIALSDIDGSEKLTSLTANNLLTGSILTDGQHEFVATDSIHSVDITNWNLQSLSITPPTYYNGVYNLGLALTSQETAAGMTAINNVTLPITVLAVNNAPEAQADTITITENSTNSTVSGSVTSNDSDPDNDALSVISVNSQNSSLGVSVAGSHGSFVINSDGSYTYTLDSNDAQVHSLNTGESLADVVSYSISDGHGGTDTALLTVTIQGITDSLSTITAGTTGTTTGTNASEYINGSTGNDYIEAGSGNDIVHTGGNQTTTTAATLAGLTFITTDDSSMLSGSNLSSSVATTTVKGYGDLVNGGNGNDALIGGDQSDLLYGGSGNDYLFGGAGSDALRGGAGNDRLEGGSGSDILRGDAGADVFIWSAGDASTILGTVSAGNNNAYGVNNNTQLANTVDLVKDFSKSDGDALDLRGLLVGEEHAGVTDAGNLSSYLHFETTNTGSNASTIIHISSNGGFADGYNSALEDQSIVLSNVNLLKNSAGTTLLNDNAVIQDLLANHYLIVDDGSANDVLKGTSGNDNLNGGAGDDSLYGDLGNDILIGGNGSDHLYGGKGDDTLTGGAGKDYFVWQSGDQGTTSAPATDHITDFNKSSDVIDISDLLDHEGSKTQDVLKSYLSVSHDSGDNVTIEIHQSANGANDITNKIVLDGVHYSDFGTGATAATILNSLIDSQHLLIHKN
ncbi:VCBS domain-containing protein [Tolumonas lignilytica]|uniref:VCBS domain-containing protein n=1 Tax=Tolumonas lignilytica TaxID=1283284 RepID=UPI0004B0FCBB